MQVRLELTKLPLTLRSIIGNRSIMQERGKSIIILLIKALTELEQANVTHRSINPNNIQLPQDLSNIVLADLSNMVDAGSERIMSKEPRRHIAVWASWSTDTLRNLMRIGILGASA